jgi:hypothetical protein
MPLNSTQRIALEASINSAVSNIPNLLDKWNQTSYIRKYEIENINEFVYGHVVGFISNAFHNIMFISEGRIATRDDWQEAEAMIFRRLPEIKNTIGREIYYHHRLR